jgi:hypothetical protein
MAAMAPRVGVDAETALVEGRRIDATGATRAIEGAADLLAAWPPGHLAVVMSCGRALARRAWPPPAYPGPPC